MASLIGALRATLSADTANFEQGMNRARRSAAGAQTGISKSLGLIKSGLAGFASGLSVGLLSQVIMKSLDYAGSLGEVASQLGVTTTQLQIFRYAAGQNGIATETMDKSLAKLTLSLNKAASGSSATIKAFNALGVNSEMIKRADPSEVLAQIADRAKEMGGTSRIAAAGAVVLGKNVMQLAPLLDQGSAGMNQLAADARRLGIVLTEEQIARADETADKIAALKNVLMVRIAGVVADNAGAIIGLANALVKLVGMLGTALRAYQAFVAGMNLAGGQLKALDPTNSRAGRAEGRLQSAVARSQLYDLRSQQAGRGSAADRAARLRRGLGMKAPGAPKPPPMPEIPQFLASGGGGGSRKRGGGGGRSAEDIAAEAQRKRIKAENDAYQFAQDQARANQDILRATLELSTDYVERRGIQLDIMDAERAAYKAELDHNVKLYELSKGEEGQSRAQADVLLALYDKKDALERQALEAQVQAQAYEDSTRLDALTLELDRDRLESEAQLAETAKEQRAVQLRLLDLSYQQERQRLEAVLADKQATFAAKEEARRRLSALSERYDNDRRNVVNSTRGPLEQYMADLPTTTAKWEEALENVKVNGLQGLEDALVDVAMGTKTVGQAFRDLASSIIADLLRIQIRKQMAAVAEGLFGKQATGTAQQAVGQAAGVAQTAAAGGTLIAAGGTLTAAATGLTAAGTTLAASGAPLTAAGTTLIGAGPPLTGAGLGLQGAAVSLNASAAMWTATAAQISAAAAMLMAANTAKTAASAAGGVPSFATGGSFNILGRRGIDNNVLQLNGLPIANVSHGETLNIGTNDNGLAEMNAASQAVRAGDMHFHIPPGMTPSQGRATGRQIGLGYRDQIARSTGTKR